MTYFLPTRLGHGMDLLGPPNSSVLAKVVVELPPVPKGYVSRSFATSTMCEYIGWKGRYHRLRHHSFEYFRRAFVPILWNIYTCEFFILMSLFSSHYLFIFL